MILAMTPLLCDIIVVSSFKECRPLCRSFLF
nr:MAG TPA: hypothetical protein [Caudoviricetes sp.]